MMRLSSIFAIGCTAAALALSGVAVAGQDVPFAALPTKVKQAIKKEVGKGEIRDIEVDASADGTLTYEVEFKVDKVRWEIELNRDGRVLERKQIRG